MNSLYWIAWSVMCTAVSGVMVFFIMQSRMEVLLSRQREELAELRAALNAQKKALSTEKKVLSAQKKALDNSLKYFEESVRRQAIDDFLAEIRVEERQIVRDESAQMKTMVRQERIFFRNIPLSNWMEREPGGVEVVGGGESTAVLGSKDLRRAIKLLR